MEGHEEQHGGLKGHTYPSLEVQWRLQEGLILVEHKLVSCEECREMQNWKMKVDLALK